MLPPPNHDNLLTPDSDADLLPMDVDPVDMAPDEHIQLAPFDRTVTTDPPCTPAESNATEGATLPSNQPSTGRSPHVTVKEVPDEGDGLPCNPWVEDFPDAVASVTDFAETYFEGITCLKREAGHNPWYPFASEEEWELAEWLSSSSLMQKDIDCYLKLCIVSLGLIRLEPPSLQVSAQLTTFP